EVGPRDGVARDLEGALGEDGERAGEGAQPRGGEARGGEDHVLLRDAHLEEALGVRVAEPLAARALGQVRVQRHDARVALAFAEEARSVAVPRRGGLVEPLRHLVAHRATSARVRQAESADSAVSNFAGTAWAIRSPP